MTVNELIKRLQELPTLDRRLVISYSTAEESFEIEKIYVTKTRINGVEIETVRLD